MTIFDGTTAPGKYRTKFVRVDEKISLSKPNDTETPHGDLIRYDNLLIDFAEASDERPQELDAGFMTFETDKQRVTINGNSLGLDIPKLTEGRRGTELRMQDLLPDFEIKTLMPPNLPHKEK